MKKIAYLFTLVIGLPFAVSAQNLQDDLYFVPGKTKTETKQKETTTVVRETRPQTVTVVTDAPAATIVVKDRKGRVRDVDDYNRRYDSKDNDFAYSNDTLYIQERQDDGLDGEWVNGEFDGSYDDYEYATRIIRFRNPRYAISISSPLYWDVVYGLNSWDWNVYADGLYAYAFPTFTNPFWWNWRYDSWRWGWGSYYGWNSPLYWGGYYGGYWGGMYWDNPYYGWHRPPYYGGGYYWGGHHRPNGVVTNRRTAYRGGTPLIGGSSTGGRTTRPSMSRPVNGNTQTRPSAVQTTRPSANNNNANATTRPDTRPTTRPAGVNSGSPSPSTRRSTTNSRIVNTREAGETPRTSTGRSTRTTRESVNSVYAPEYNRESTVRRSGSTQSTTRSYSPGSSRSTRTYTPNTNTQQTRRSNVGEYTPRSSSSFSSGSSSGGSSRSSGTSSTRSSGSSGGGRSTRR